VTGAWICMPEGTPIVDDSCALCGLYDPPVSHFRSHFNLDSCVAKSFADRSFARKDKLNEHIHRIHLREDLQPAAKGRLAPGSALLEHWKREPSSREALWCGFCVMYCSNWSERLSHVAAHLQKGTDISLWGLIS
jgi:hypothetical protein